MAIISHSLLVFLRTQYLRTMRSYFVILLFMVASCGDAKKSETADAGISTSIVSNPHSADGVDTAAASLKPTLNFADTVHNFGTVHEGETVMHEFSFTNNGKSPLIISSASGSCGCTVADYPKEPVPPGQTGIMKVSFNSTGREGHQEKMVTLQTNTLQSIHHLYITAEVVK